MHRNHNYHSDLKAILYGTAAMRGFADLEYCIMAIFWDALLSDPRNSLKVILKRGVCVISGKMTMRLPGDVR